MGAVSELSTRVEQLRTLLADNSQRDRQDAEARARLFRDEIGGQIKDGFTRFDDASRGLRGEVIKLVTTLGETTAGSVGKLGQVQSEKLGDTVQRVQLLADATERHLTDVKKEAAESGKALREEVNTQLQALLVAIRDTLEQIGTTQKESLDQVGDQLRQLTQRNVEMNEQLRNTIEERLEILRKGNETKLEEMRRTVDEKLQDTLEKRLSSSFKQVSDLLAQVFESVGQMKTLADDVGDLNRVLTNVKARGTWAEVWLGNLLEQVMAPEQFQRNVEIKPGSGERVDFAIKLPGQGEDTIWLPIDSKFPTEDYEVLVAASDRSDATAVEIALKKLETRIRNEAASICGKYICPPQTTDFAILYVPTEGLYAEVIRRPGLLDDLQRKCRIVVAGPTVLLALLNSLRMGLGCHVQRTGPPLRHYPPTGVDAAVDRAPQRWQGLIRASTFKGRGRACQGLPGSLDGGQVPDTLPRGIGAMVDCAPQRRQGLIRVRAQPGQLPRMPVCAKAQFSE